MAKDVNSSILKHFSVLSDPRRDNRRHKLIDIITIAICAVIGNADSFEHIAEFGRAKHEWFKGFLELPHGIPSADTFERVFARIDPVEFKTCFLEWIRAISQLTKGEIIAVDGKTLRRSHDKSNGKSAIHMVSAWACANSLVLGQVKTEEKSNEITAIPELLEALDIKECIITIDAMGCQKTIASKIIDKEADYVLAVKNNHMVEETGLFGEYNVQFCYHIADIRKTDAEVYPCRAAGFSRTIDNDRLRGDETVAGCMTARQVLVECYGEDATFSVIDICPANQVAREPFIARCCRSERTGTGVHNNYFGAVVHWGATPRTIAEAVFAVCDGWKERKSKEEPEINREEDEKQ